MASVGDMNPGMWIMSSLICGCSSCPLYCVFSRFVYSQLFAVWHYESLRESENLPVMDVFRLISSSLFPRVDMNRLYAHSMCVYCFAYMERQRFKALELAYFTILRLNSAHVNAAAMAEVMKQARF